jgi:hypothetical protein
LGAGVAEKDIAASMHYPSRRTTPRYLYADWRAVPVAVAKLPDLAPQRTAATGADNHVAHVVRIACANQTSSVEFGGVASDLMGAAGSDESAEKQQSPHFQERPRSDSNRRITDLQSVPLVRLGTRPIYIGNPSPPI